MHVVVAALVLTLANAGKPLVVDDTAYVLFARQIAAHPGDPYGFSIHWYQVPEPAFGVLAPPLVPYWLAGALALLGDEPLRWKLALLPFALALAAALRSLFARFAPGLEIPLLWLAILSPTLLPFVNLMLDVPCLALALSALAVFLAACERRRLGAAALAGTLAGLALQTKYTAATSLAALLAFGALASRVRETAVALACAAAVFAGWEGLVALRYGSSHFLHVWPVLRPQLVGSGAGPLLAFPTGFLVLVGALAPAVGLVGLAALGAPARIVAGAALAAAAVFAAIPWLPALPVGVSDEWPHAGAAPIEGLAFLALGALTAASVLAVLVAELRRGADLRSRFLAAWLAIEVAGFAALSPFLAARRVLGVSLVALLVCGRALARGAGAEAARVRLRAPLAFGAALGALFAASDFADAVAERDAVAATAARLAELGADPERETVWFAGHWGFQFYAERAGMRALVPGASPIRAGDWLVVPEGVTTQEFLVPPRDLVASEPVAARSASPWSTLPWAYTGAIPIRPRSEARLRVGIFRATRDFVPGHPRRS
jgi:hypothetical protein